MYHHITKGLFLIIFSAIAALSLSSCGRKPANSAADYIGIDAAKSAALKAADISSGEVIFSSAGLDSRNGTFFYQVVFTENGVEHKYDIDALTGVVIAESHAPRTDYTPADSNLVQNETSTETASTAALPEETTNSENILESQTPAQTTPTTESLPQTTKPSQTNTTQTPETPQSTASAPSKEPPATTQNTPQQIDENTALSIALTHAGIAEQNIAVSKVKSDIEDGRSIFEVEFVTLDGVEYDYEISKADGTIISFDYDAEELLPPIGSVGAGTGIITETQAKQTVIDRVPGATEEIIKIKLDEDDGRLEYEGSLFYDTMKYEFKIDAYSGTVIEWEAKLIH